MGECEDEYHHINNDKTNNKLTNLQAVTYHHRGYNDPIQVPRREMDAINQQQPHARLFT